MDWMAETLDRRADPRALMPGAKSLVMLGLNYGPGGDPLAALGAKNAGTISVYARHRDYHDVIKGKLKQLAAFLVAAARPERGGRQGLRRHRAADGKAARRARRARLAGQAHQSGLARFRLLALSRRIFTDLELPPDAPEVGPLRSLPRLPRRLPDRRVPRALPARRAALHLLSDHRAQGPIPREFARDRQSHLWLRRLPRRLPVEQIRRAAGARRNCSARRSRRAAARRTRAPGRRGVPRAFAGGPIKRIGRARFLRNVLIAIGNSGDPALAAARGRAARR